VVSEEPLHAELKEFLRAVQTRSEPLITLEDGRRALAVALDVVAAIGQHADQVGLEQLTAAKS